MRKSLFFAHRATTNNGRLPGFTLTGRATPFP
jgi:hypothetical protein